MYYLAYKKIVVKLLSKALRKKLPRKVAIIGVSATESQKLNLIYRRKNKPANVLSFRYGPEYGEIIVCPAVVRAEAKRQGNTYKYQMTWMVLHGIIHLAGVHHEGSRAVDKKVVQLEHRVMRKLFSSLKF